MNNSVTVQEGLCVTIPCTFTAGNRTKFINSTGMWRDSSAKFVAYSNNTSTKETKPNFHVVGNPDNGDCTLTITDARKEDAGSYHFRFEESETRKNKYNYLSSAVKVKVTDLKHKPQIIINEKLIAGEETTLTCNLPGDCTGTSSHVEWLKNNTKETWKNSTFVTFVPSKSDHRTNVTCKVTFKNGKSVTSSRKLKVLYPPSVTITTEENKPVNRSVDLSGQKAVTLICRADSIPQADVTWHNENNIVNRSKSSATLRINMTNHGIYVCLAQNDLGVNLKHVEVFLQGTPSDSQSFFQEMTVRDILIGVACGIMISLIIVFLLFKFYLRNQPKLTSDLNHNLNHQGLPSSQDFPPDDNHQIYAQVQKPKLQAPGSSNESSDLNDVSYATVTFSKALAKGTPKQPETEYSEIRFP
ncbi:sialic acid-binding Ig-like lectin 12 [Lithobates pipiens]